MDSQKAKLTENNKLKITIVENYPATVKLYGGQTAVIDGNRKVNHRELLSLSIAVAIEVKRRLPSHNLPIAVFLPKSLELVVSNIGIGFSGNMYMNLDVKTPVLRLEKIHMNISPALYITKSLYKETLIGIGVEPEKIIIIEEIEEHADSEQENILISDLAGIIDTDPYCIINTSGSTGIPKGVVLNHRCFYDFYYWAVDSFGFDNNTVIGSLSPAFFDLYSFELSSLLCAGACIVVIPDNLSAFPAKILQLIDDNSINFLFWVPTIMVNIANLNLLPKFRLDTLKLVFFAGEVFPSKHLAYWVRHLPLVQFVNLYGPMETTVDSVFHVVEKDYREDDPLPIGKPCRNTGVLILKDDDTVAGINEVGELCIRGSSLAMGYYNDPVKTSAAFTQNPLNKHYPELMYRTGDLVYINEDGLIMFMGRKDYQIKHLGCRIELSEIENAAIGIEGVRNGCCVYLAESKEIVLFIEGEASLDVKTLRIALAKVLPKYMIPNRFITLSTMPMNSNGKIDRVLLQNSLIAE